MKKIDKERIRAMGYPAAMVVFALVVAALFVSIARFLSASIDAAISAPDEMQIQAQLVRVDTEAYDTVAAKLHLPAIGPAASESAKTEPLATSATEASSTQQLATPVAQAPQTAEARSAFTLAVYNSTKRPGVAGTVKNDLTSAGFTVAKTGNSTPEEPRTIVQIKERVQASPAILEEVISLVGKRFTVDEPQILDDASPYDIVITIGAQ